MPIGPSSLPSYRPRWLSLVLAALVVAIAFGLYSNRLMIPEPFNPWAPLDVMATPNWLTSYKLSRSRSSPMRCLAALSQTAMDYDLLPDRVTGPGCGYDNAVLLRKAGVRMGTPPSLSCPMALSFFMWEKYSLQPAAVRHFGQRVASIDHLGSYACRNVNRGEDAAPDKTGQLQLQTRSRHATANALDVAGFTLENGKHITVSKDWQGTGVVNSLKPEAALLNDAHKGACQFFNGVLGPDYNAVHRNHFHLETGGYAMCR